MGRITSAALSSALELVTFSRMNSTTVVDSTTRRDGSLGNAGGMLHLRSVEGVHRSTGFHWVGNGFYVSTYFPSTKLPAERVSPFVLMDYGPPHEFAPLERGKRGVGWHPHRGFETVTLAWEGAVAHRDNAGHSGVIQPGDAQWMTAGAGIFHEEYHSEEVTRRGGRLHMMQLWVNLPREHKQALPAYQPLRAPQFPNIALPGGGNVRVIAGDFEGAHGPARTFTPITMLDITLRRGETVPVDLPESYNAIAVVAEGRVTSDESSAGAGELLLFANDGDRLTLTAEEDAHVVLLSGKPIDEPIVQYGPFVMNSVEEIRQAVYDLEAGKFGPVPE
jgi:redox-sensitive bicupin YhaK (pirin superfamily)